MQIKKSISLVFIFLIFLSLAGSFSPTDFAENNTSQTETQTQLVEDSENTLHEFRETVKLNIASGLRTASYNYIPSLLFLSGLTNEPHQTYLLPQFINKRSYKLFINFGALII